MITFLKSPICVGLCVIGKGIFFLQCSLCSFPPGQAVLNETDLATLILNMMIRMSEYYPSRDSEGAIVRPLPKVKRLLSEATCLPHIVQVRTGDFPDVMMELSSINHRPFGAYGVCDY